MLEHNKVQKIKEYLASCYPKEGAVAVVHFGDGLVFLENCSESPENEFKISNETTLSLFSMGLRAMVHSHPDFPNYPSKVDMQSQINTAVPWGICTTTSEGCTDIIWYGDQVEKRPLVGRPYIYGVCDCYSLIRDYYKLELDIDLKEHPRDWAWWEKEDMYENLFAETGFKEISDKPQAGDVFLAKIRSNVFNHGGIYLGNELILHHLTSKEPLDFSRLSKREPINRWQNYIGKWLRYENN